MAVRVEHPLCARLYVRQSEQAERLGLSERRAELLAGLSGRVLEVGAGNGLNFGHYPAAVTELIAVEPEPHLREHAERTALEAAVPITVVDAVAEELPFPDAAFDAAVASLMLCSVTDVPAALAELHRVLRPAGELRFFEHVASSHPAWRTLQRAADATVWPRLSGGCHLARDTDALIEAAGFAIERCERFTFRIPPVDPPKTHVLGIARRVQAPGSRPVA
ncbi:MAG TPA: class I SAM-dependent methyltransferase [Myxococcota bacterium]|nr:class I SAM-dependent methyltransferase [Myxococcota bacterium]